MELLVDHRPLGAHDNRVPVSLPAGVRAPDRLDPIPSFAAARVPVPTRPIRFFVPEAGLMRGGSVRISHLRSTVTRLL